MRVAAVGSKSVYFFGGWRLRCGRGPASDVRGRAEPRGESSGRAAVNGGDAGTDADSMGCSGGRRSRPVWAMSGGVVSLSSGFAGSLADSEMRGLFEGVDGPRGPPSDSIASKEVSYCNRQAISTARREGGPFESWYVRLGGMRRPRQEPGQPRPPYFVLT